MEIWRYINNELMEGEVFSGIPDMKWNSAVQELSADAAAGGHGVAVSTHH